MLKLRYDTPLEWVKVVGEDLHTFLRDHAHNERKVAAAAMALSQHLAMLPHQRA